MDPTYDFLKAAAKGEFTTPGGWMNFITIAVLALAVSAAETGGLLAQILVFAYHVLDRVLHLFERLFELIAGLASAEFTPSVKPEPYRAPHEHHKRTTALIFIGLLGIGCCLAIGGARYPAKAAPNHPPRKPGPSAVIAP